jgi:hypothetical protein
MTYVVLSVTVEVEVNEAVSKSVKVTVVLASGGAETVSVVVATVEVTVGVAAVMVVVVVAVLVTVVGTMDSTTISQTTLKGSFTGPRADRSFASFFVRACSAIIASSLALRRRSRRLGIRLLTSVTIDVGDGKMNPSGTSDCDVIVGSVSSVTENPVNVVVDVTILMSITSVEGFNKAYLCPW